MIQALFSQNGLREASARIDRYGRIELLGAYKDMQEVELAFSLAQSVAGIRWTSPVTPDHVRLKKWGNVFKEVFPQKKSETPPPPGPGTGPATTRDAKARRQQEHHPPVVEQHTTLVEQRPPAVEQRASEQEKRSPVKYALVVGVSHFKANEKYKLKTGREIDLKYASKDARNVYDYLVDPKYGDFEKKNVRLILDGEATRANIEKALNDIKRKAEYNDQVIVYFSSHGKPVHDGSMSIITHDADLSNPYAVARTSFSCEYLKDFVFQTKAKNLVVVLDVCYSGNAFKEIKGFYNTQSNVDFSQDNQGISRNVMAKTLLGAKDVILDDEVVRDAAVIDKNSVRVLISASDYGERSWESETLKSSVFTGYFVEGLKKKQNVKRAFEYARPNVVKQVKQEKQTEQHPQVVTNSNKWDIAI
jgi:uncharacterized caspase-like protein